MLSIYHLPRTRSFSYAPCSLVSIEWLHAHRVKLDPVIKQKIINQIERKPMVD